MNDNNSTRAAGEENANPAQAVSEAKGKGKAAEPGTQNMSMDEEDETSDEETGAEEEAPEVEEEADDDNMEEIDTDNIIPSGRRTRGKNIDFAKAAEELPEEGDEDDEDDDDFEEKEEDAMQE